MFTRRPPLTDPANTDEEKELVLIIVVVVVVVERTEGASDDEKDASESGADAFEAESGVESGRGANNLWARTLAKLGPIADSKLEAEAGAGALPFFASRFVFCFTSSSSMFSFVSLSSPVRSF